MFDLVLHYSNFAASDILLSVFFFVVGLELIEEIKNGELRDFKHAALPAFAAFGGVITPALIFVAIIFSANLPLLFFNGWAIPTATDVAFSLAVLALFAKHLKSGTKLFLLVLAVVDDIIGIIIIAFVFSKNINAIALLSSVLLTILWSVLCRQKKCHFLLLIPLAAAVWFSVYEAGIHPTIAGVLLGITVPATRKDIAEDDLELIAAEKNPSMKVSRAKLWADKISPFSTYFVVPVFALVSIVVSIHELINGFFSGNGAAEKVTGNGHGTQIATEATFQLYFSPHTLFILAFAISVALIFGKPLGILFFAWIGQHLTPLKLFHGLKVRDLVGTACLGGIGFTVSFLIADLSFFDPLIVAVSRIGVVAGSLLSAVLGICVFAITITAKKKRKTSKTNIKKEK